MKSVCTADNLSKLDAERNVCSPPHLSLFYLSVFPLAFMYVYVCACACLGCIVVVL
jgi:hypothetical protein